MLRVAVTGPVGQGKSQLLARLAGLLAGRGEPVLGLLAEAEGGRVGPQAGAKAYRLRPLGPTPRRQGLVAPPWLLAERWEEAPGAPGPDRPDWALGMRYRFHPEAIEAASQWAQAQVEEAGPAPEASFLLLDEFGKAEAAGGGWLPAWRHWSAWHVGVLVVAVRQDHLEAAAEALGGAWDWVLWTEDPQAWGRLAALATEAQDWRRVGAFGAAGGAVEASLGAYLHGTMLPGRGLAMASLQTALLVRLIQGLAQPSRASWAGLVSAGLKALSPAGNRLRPMVAIAVQAWLMAGAAALGRGRWPALVLGGAAVGAWAASQGLFLAWLLAGEALWRGIALGLQAADAFAQAQGLGGLPVLGRQAPWLLGAYVGGWSVVTASVAGAAAWGPGGPVRQVPAWLEALSQGPGAPVGAQGGLGSPGGLWASWWAELRRPSLWLPLALLAGMLRLGGGTWQDLAWLALRAAAVLWVLLLVLRRGDLARLTAWLARRGWWGPALAFEEARHAAQAQGKRLAIDHPGGMAQDQAGPRR